ncbi:hypothetical protein SAMN05421542_0556 [Chryseobacterium jejuense]|uniref:Uncharacterized protein n=1 Tax=Chryseobacterium jejuense TaxID=445960 RepID=A0A2X2X7Y7_CHRJE|nr:hypothetical protein SAMN05421542_0556 [Chryseobacterium jejuense]SQB46821.1 Uncharacterised protein [Chryseobacterium jejuense]
MYQFTNHLIVTLLNWYIATLANNLSKIKSNPEVKDPDTV